MKIKQSRADTPTYCFASLKNGDVFKYGSWIYLKISSNQAYNLNNDDIIAFAASIGITVKPKAILLVDGEQA